MSLTWEGARSEEIAMPIQRQPEQDVKGEAVIEGWCDAWGDFVLFADLPEPSKRLPLKIGANADETPAADIAAFDATVYA
jgi:hypothetical protein